MQKDPFDADLRNAETGQPWPVRQLAELINVQTSKSSIPQEMNLMVRIEDPVLAKQIVMVWAEVFIEDSIQNIENRLIQARQFRFSQYERNENGLAKKEDGRLNFLR